MKKTLVAALCLLFVNNTQAQYYNSALGLTGTALQNQLQVIISNGHLQNTYNSLWSHYGSTDIKTGNLIWDIYSDGNTTYTFDYNTEQCSGTLSPQTEGDCYNREHTWPATYFNDFYPMYADLFHVMPTDGVVNNKRGNFPYGKVTNPNWTSLNGSKLGLGSTYSSYSSSNPNHWEFEPIDEFKGDVARNYFYMSTRYKGLDGSWYNWEMANGAQLKQDAINLLLQWHHQDPVSPKEIARNNAVSNIQNNRNPFIDYPVFADCIWGTQDCTSLNTLDLDLASKVTLYPNPSSDILTLNVPSQWIITHVQVMNVFGQLEINLNTLANHSLSVSQLTSGLHHVVIETDKGKFTKNFLKN